MGRRGENIRKRKDGRWEARVIICHDGNGKAIYRSLYGKTYAEAKEKKNRLADRTVSVTAGKRTWDDKRTATFQQVMAQWLASRKDNVKESTYAHYSNLLEKHLFPELGPRLFSQLDDEMLNAFLRRKLHTGRLDGSGGLSPKTVSDIRSVLLLGIAYARQQKYPCAVHAPLFCPKTRRPGIRILSLEEQNRLERVLFQGASPLHLGILTALYGGLRIGEVCALKWQDISFDTGTVCVAKTMLRIRDMSPGCRAKTRILIDRPKTESSCRTVPLPSFLLSFLHRHRQQADRYLLTGTASYLEPRVCLEKYKQVLTAAGVEPVTFHTLRHTFATRCVESGFDAKSLSEILGHANVSTTLQRYVHPSMEMKREQMERLEKLSIYGQNSGHSLVP